MAGVEGCAGARGLSGRLMLAVGGLAGILACGPGPQPAEPAGQLLSHETPAGASGKETVENSPEPITGARFRGRNIGYRMGHGVSPAVRRIELPEGMQLRSSANFAGGHRLAVATEGADLVLLLTDEEGVVLDDVTLRGKAESTAVLDCQEDGVLGVLDLQACPRENMSAPAETAFRHDQRQLTPTAEPASCDCFMVHEDRAGDELDDPP